MINIKDEICKALKSVCDNVSDSYPSKWENFPVIQYSEEDNNVYEFTDGKEDKSYIKYKIDIWHDSSTSEITLAIDKVISSLGLARILCQDVTEASGLKYKVMKYEGIIDNETKYVYQK